MLAFLSTKALFLFMFLQIFSSVFIFGNLLLLSKSQALATTRPQYYAFLRVGNSNPLQFTELL